MRDCSYWEVSWREENVTKKIITKYTHGPAWCVPRKNRSKWDPCSSSDPCSRKVSTAGIFYYVIPFLFNIFGFSFFFKYFIYLFMRIRREGQRPRQRENQAPRGEPDARLDPGSPGSGPGPKVALNC